MINIYVGKLPYETSESDLTQMFSEHGQVARSSIIMDRETGRSRGFGFVEIPNDAEGQAAIEAINEMEFGSRRLTMNEARPRAPRGGAYRDD